MLSTLYDSGARVQELIDLSVRDFTSCANAILVLTGKGNKQRRVPLMENTASLIEFGRYAGINAERNGKKPDTFDKSSIISIFSVEMHK